MSISGLVVEYIVAIDVTRVRFPADAILSLDGGNRNLKLARAAEREKQLGQQANLTQYGAGIARKHAHSMTQTWAHTPGQDRTGDLQRVRLTS